MTSSNSSIQTLSVIVPTNPFAPAGLEHQKHCLCALDVGKLMEWWPGTPHSPHRNAAKVKAIQRSLDWRRVVNIAAYLLQREIEDAPDKINKYFREIYEPKKNEPGREWPPKINRVVGFEKSEFPVFSNVLIHVNGAVIEESETERGAAHLIFDVNDQSLNFSVIDGQHRINGAYLAVKLLQETKKSATWEIPAEIFLDLDKPGSPPSKQAQIFIDVNFHQKKVDRSLVADLFPTARGTRKAINNTERAQDVGRKLMLETGPLVGMIQIPGIKYGVKDVITLATLNSAIEDILPILENNDIESLEAQTDFLAECLSAWFEASGRFEPLRKGEDTVLDPENVAYQGRILVSILALTPVLILRLKKANIPFISRRAEATLTRVLKKIAKNARLLEGNVFITKTKFKQRGYLGSGGIGRFRDSLWAVACGDRKLSRLQSSEMIAKFAKENRGKVNKQLASD